MAWGLLGALVTIVATIVAVHAGAYGRLVALRQRMAGPCEADGEHDGLGTLVRLVVAESVATLWLAAAACRPRATGRRDGARGGIVLVGPFWLPGGALRILARRLAAHGLAVVTRRAPRRADGVALARLTSAVEHLDRATGRRGVTLVLFGRAAHSAESIVAIADRDAIDRLILLGARAHRLARPPCELVCISSRDDAWVQPPGHGLHAAAANVQLSGVGHLSLLVAAHAATIVREACDRRTGTEPRCTQAER